VLVNGQTAVRAGGSERAAGRASITIMGAGLFMLQAVDPSQPGAVLNQDSTVNGASNPAPASMQIFVTGHGPLQW
jgi:uncharacterized protein (TIGR03437 family)